MAIQTANLGTAPSGAGGDTFRSAATKFNENFSNNGHAASRLVGAQAGNVMEVGAFGLGSTIPNISMTPSTIDTAPTQIASWYDTWAVIHFKNQDYNGLNKPNWTQLMVGRNASKGVLIRSAYNGAEVQYNLRGEHNTTIDGNGFIKAASPIVQLYSDKIELNDEAKLQNITLEKLGIGDYLIKGSAGFAQEGWYIETPKDANGNVLFSVIYTTLENGDISVKTYKKKFDFETVSIVADLDNPVDITEGRWIDLRLQELPQPESITSPEFQPTGLAQAVATVMESYHDPEQ